MTIGHAHESNVRSTKYDSNEPTQLFSRCGSDDEEQQKQEGEGNGDDVRARGEEATLRDASGAPSLSSIIFSFTYERAKPLSSKNPAFVCECISPLAPFFLRGLPFLLLLFLLLVLLLLMFTTLARGGDRAEVDDASEKRSEASVVEEES